MPSLTLPDAPLGGAAEPALFGGNILAPRGEMTGPGSHAEAADALGVTGLRYPGGALTEDYFDLADPEATRVVDPDTGRELSFIPLSEAMAHAAEAGRPLTIVLPTRTQLSETVFDDNGDRMPAIDREILEGFLRDVVSGSYGPGPVAAFEIGNEYWGSGRMTAVEYGRLASDMAEIIDRTLQELEADVPQAVQIDILVQAGTNFGSSNLSEQYEGLPEVEVLADLEATYGIDLPESVAYPNGGLDWTEINTLLLLSQFSPEGLEAADGVVAHVYSRAPELMHTRWFQLEQIEDSWLPRDPSLEIHVTEWNQKSNTDVFDGERDYGLYQAQEMLEQVEEFLRFDVEAAHVWPLIQNTPTALAQGRSFDEATVAGEMFALMSQNLPGMWMLDFTPGAGRDTEYETPEMDVHAFSDGRDLLFFFTSNLRDGVVQTDVDISNLVDGFAGMEITTLGVAPGAAPGSNDSPPVLEAGDPAELHVDGLIETILAPGEIMMVRLAAVRPTTDFAPVFSATGEVTAPPEVAVMGVSDAGMSEAALGQELMAALTGGAAPGVELVPAPDGGPGPGDGSGEQEAEDDESALGALGGLSWALGVLPLLFLLG